MQSSGRRVPQSRERRKRLICKEVERVGHKRDFAARCLRLRRKRIVFGEADPPEAIAVTPI